VELDVLKQVLTNLKHFNVEQKLQQATIAFIVKNMADKDDTADLDKVFRFLDKN